MDTYDPYPTAGFEAIILIASLPEDLSNDVQELERRIAGITGAFVTNNIAIIQKLTEYFEDIIVIIPQLQYSQCHNVFLILKGSDIIIDEALFEAEKSRAISFVEQLKNLIPS